MNKGVASQDIQSEAALSQRVDIMNRAHGIWYGNKGDEREHPITKYTSVIVKIRKMFYTVKQIFT